MGPKSERFLHFWMAKATTGLGARVDQQNLTGDRPFRLPQESSLQKNVFPDHLVSVFLGPTVIPQPPRSPEVSILGEGSILVGILQYQVDL